MVCGTSSIDGIPITAFTGFLGQESLKLARSSGAWRMAHMDALIWVYKGVARHPWHWPCHDSYSPSKRSLNLRFRHWCAQQEACCTQVACADIATPYERASARSGIVQLTMAFSLGLIDWDCERLGSADPRRSVVYAQAQCKTSRLQDTQNAICMKASSLAQGAIRENLRGRLLVK